MFIPFSRNSILQSCTVAYQVVVTAQCAGTANDTTSTVNVTAQCGVDSAQRVMEKAADENSYYGFTVTYAGLPYGYVVDRLFGYAVNGSCQWYVYRNDTSVSANFYNRTVSTFIVNAGQVVLLRYGIYKAPTTPPTTPTTPGPGSSALSIHGSVFLQVCLPLFAMAIVAFSRYL